ncbi:GIY-YIG nuclease family protein [Clostridium perfringens]|nr:GIY-YIG nuclease family protein [Clostridium perfringens]
MEFKTIYLLSETYDEVINILPTDKGILFANGNKISDGLPKQRPYPLFVSACNNVNKNFNLIIDKYGEKLNISSLSYKCINDDLELCKVYLYIIKTFNPIGMFQKTIEEYLNKLDLQSKGSYCYQESFEKINNPITISDIFINKNEINKIPNSMGIYFMYNQDKDLMYIGKSIHLNSRVANHLAGRTHTDDICHNFKYIKYIEIDNEELLDDYETYYINIYKPKLNVSKVYTYRSERYTPKYNSKLNEFINLEHMIQYKIAKEYLEERFKVSKLIAAKEEEMLKDIADMKNLFL